jgi:Zn-dependent M28 family amino/carboxypeptidase
MEQRPSHTSFVSAITMVTTLVLVTLILPGYGCAAEASDQNPAILDKVSGSHMSQSMDQLVSYNTRAFNTNSSLNSSIYIHDELQGLGLWVYYQYLDVNGFSVRNVVAVKNGSDSTAPQYLFGAHYDSAPVDHVNYSSSNVLAAPGADDDASGVAAVIELARVLEGSSFQNTLKFVAFAAEETGLNGSSYFAQHERSVGVQYEDTAIMDMIGFRAELENRVMIFSGSTTNNLSHSIAVAVDHFDIDISIEVVSGYTMRASDHASFWEMDYPSLLIIEQMVNQAPVNPYYHSANDTPDHISIDQMVAVTKALLGGFLLLENPLERNGVPYLAIVIGVTVAAVAAIAIIYAIRKRRSVE